MREGDTLARLGGDEFVVMLSGLSPQREHAAGQAEKVATKLRQAMARAYQLGEHHHDSTVSIGVALFTDAQGSLDNILKWADMAMYQAKADGRNSVRFFNPDMQAQLQARAELETDLRDAVAAGQFELHYQPQVDASGHILGAEALLRWPHPTRGMVSPAQFIPVAESSGLILPLGRWILHAACHQLVLWAEHLQTAPWRVAVNVSAKQFHHPDFVADVLAALRDTGASPSRLELELTESQLVEDMDSVIAKMSVLRAHGVRFSLDDFGTGYSSLAYLKRLPLYKLKIDQGFVRDLLTDPNDAAIVRTIVALGTSLDLEVIAEGVETEAQKAALADLGCQQYQGYLLGRPLPASALLSRVVPREM
jgi:predicted signal transduction protein with EAL and GGDEF domain